MFIFQMVLINNKPMMRLLYKDGDNSFAIISREAHKIKVTANIHLYHANIFNEVIISINNDIIS